MLSALTVPYAIPVGIQAERIPALLGCEALQVEGMHPDSTRYQ